mgnify:CR=1 FL=1
MKVTHHSQTLDSLLDKIRSLVARHDIDGFGMRQLAQHVGISPSVIYYYFKNKDEMLRAMYQREIKLLGAARRELSPAHLAEDRLRDLIIFQFQYAESIVAVLKYYFSNRELFAKQDFGYLPLKSTLHVEEVIEYGVAQKQWVSRDIESDARVLTHTINGYVLEYFPAEPPEQELETIVQQIVQFSLAALDPHKKPDVIKYT